MNEESHVVQVHQSPLRVAVISSLLTSWSPYRPDLFLILKDRYRRLGFVRHVYISYLYNINQKYVRFNYMYYKVQVNNLLKYDERFKFFFQNVNRFPEFQVGFNCLSAARWIGRDIHWYTYKNVVFMFKNRNDNPWIIIR